MANRVFSILSVFIGVMLGSLLGIQSNSINLPLVSILASAVLVVFFLVIQQKSEYKNIWYKPSNVFIISYLAVNLQYVFDLVLNFKTYDDFVFPQTVDKIAIIGAIGLVAFNIGYFLSKNKHSEFELNDTSRTYYINTGVIAVFQVILFVAWLSSVNFMSLITGIAYSGKIKEGTAETNLELLLYCANIALLSAIVLNAKDKTIDSIKSFLSQASVFSWIVIGSYSCLRLISGDRGPFINTVLAVFFAYASVTKVRIKLSRILVLFFAFALLINIIGIAREGSLDRSFSERFVSAFTDFNSSKESRFSEKTVINATEELAISSRCNQIAVQLVDNKNYPLNNGRYALYQILQCIPFMPSFLQNTLGIPQEKLSSVILVTDEYAGRHDLYQLGTTIIADSYLDLGLVGVFLMMLLIGYVFKKIDFGVCIQSNYSICAIIIVLLISSMSSYIPRSTLFAQFKNVIPILLFIYASKLIGNKK